MRYIIIILLLLNAFRVMGQEPSYQTEEEKRQGKRIRSDKKVKVVPQSNVIAPHDDGVHANMALIVGMWIPRGGAAQFGNSVTLGYQTGIKSHKNSFDFTMLFNINDRHRYYAGVHGGSPEITSHILGGYMGIDYRRDVYSRGNHQVSLLTGFGFDGIDELPNSGRYVVSYNFNAGVGYRIYYNSRRSYLGLNVQYNFVHYRLDEIIGFNNNPISVRLAWGFQPRRYR